MIDTKGFTLTEMIIVVAILATLSAASFFSYYPITKDAKNTSKEIGIGTAEIGIAIKNLRKEGPSSNAE